MPLNVLLQCKGVKFSEIPQCGGLYNLDTLMRAIFDLALLVFLGFSMVPGLCTYNPFLINMWMIPPMLMDEEEKMLRKTPKLRELLKKTKNDESFKDLEGNCEKKEGKTEESPFAEGVAQEEISLYEEKIEGKGEQNSSKDKGEGEEGPVWNSRYIDEDYEIHHWEKNLNPEESVKDSFVRNLIAGGTGEGESGEMHETQREKLRVIGETNKKSLSGEIGSLEWDYPKEKS